MKEKALRQGEIYLTPCPNFEEDTNRSYDPLSEVEGGVIREGEKSGHKHQVKGAKLYTDRGGNLYIKADSPSAVIEHPEHKPLKLNRKYYKVEIQREYDEAKHSRKVSD